MPLALLAAGGGGGDGGGGGAADAGLRPRAGCGLIGGRSGGGGVGGSAVALGLALDPPCSYRRLAVVSPPSRG